MPAPDCSAVSSPIRSRLPAGELMTLGNMRQSGVDAPIFVAIETGYCDGRWTPPKPNNPIAEAQRRVIADLLLVGRIESLFLGDGRITRAPWLAIAEDVVEPNFHLAWPAHTGCVGTFCANDLKLPTAIARIIVVQNLSCLQHGVPRPLQPTDHDKPAWSGRCSHGI
jgi:hypothetical protein